MTTSTPQKSVLTTGEACRLLSAALGRFVAPSDFKAANETLSIEPALQFDWRDCYDAEDVQRVSELMRRSDEQVS